MKIAGPFWARNDEIGEHRLSTVWHRPASAQGLQALSGLECILLESLCIRGRRHIASFWSCFQAMVSTCAGMRPKTGPLAAKVLLRAGAGWAWACRCILPVMALLGQRGTEHGAAVSASNARALLSFILQRKPGLQGGDLATSPESEQNYIVFIQFLPYL